MRTIGTLMLLGFAALGGAALTTTAQAQVPRTVLMEEGTNWSCGPCASMNPIVDAFLEEHPTDVIHFAYHPNWPGSDDPMYLNATTDNQSRVVTYYKISGVPSVTFDGATPYVPGSYALLQQSYDDRIKLTSPIRINVTRSVENDEVKVGVDVIAVGDVSKYTKLTLQTVGVERVVYQRGSNGEPAHMNPMRAMMPNWKGTSITLKQGDSLHYDFSYPIKPAYAPEKLFEVAFVQNDATHEVLQAAATSQHIKLEAAAGEKPVQLLTGSSGSTNLDIENTTNENLTFTSSYKPIIGKDWNVTVGTGSSIAIPAGQKAALPLAVTMGSGTYTKGLVSVAAISSRGDTLVSSYPVKFIAPGVKVAFIDVSGDTTMSKNTTASLDRMKMNYVPLTDLEAQSIAPLRSFEALIIEANKWILTGDNKTLVTDYQNAGGKMLITGGEIGYGLAEDPDNKDVAFLANVLKATYVKDSAGPTTVHGIADDPVSGMYATTDVNIYGTKTNADSPNQPDEIMPTNGSVPVYYYGTGTSQVAGIRWNDDKSKLVYLAFGVQNLLATNRQVIIQNALDWMGVAAAVSEDSKPSFTLEQNYPNPFGVSTTIRYTLSEASNVRLEVTDLRGVVVNTIASGYTTAGPHVATFSSAGLAKGTYFVTLHANGRSEVRTMTIE